MGRKLTSTEAQEEEHSKKQEMSGRVKCFFKVTGGGATGGLGVEGEPIGK